MPTRFFKLPLSVQLKVIKTLNYNGVFNLSLCSQRMYGIIQKINFSKVDRIKYVLHPNRLDVLVEDIDQKQEYMATVARININLGEGYATQLGSMKSNFYFEKCYRGLNLYYLLSYNEISAEICHESLVEHISGIINDPPRILLEVDGQDNWNPSLFIEGVNEIVLKPDNINANFFDYVKFFPNLECLIIKGELKTAPMFRYIPNMFVPKSGNFARSIMQNFTGERLILYRAECNNQCILNFLQKWINGNVEADYVFVKSRNKRHIFNPKTLLAAIETKEWNPKLRKRKYTLFLGYGPRWKQPQEIDTEQYRDIRRKKDGKIASFLITPEFFTFHSWVLISCFYENDPHKYYSLAHNDIFKELYQNSLIEHVNGIINNPQRIFLYVQISNPTLFDAGVRDITLDLQSNKVDANIFEYVKTFPNVEFLSIKDSMSNAPPFTKIPALSYNQAENFANFILENFTGRFLSLRNAECSNEYVLEFIRKWIEGDIKVEDVRIRSKDRKRIFNRAALLSEIETEEWDPEVRPGKFSYFSRYFSYYSRYGDVFVDIQGYGISGDGSVAVGQHELRSQRTFRTIDCSVSRLNLSKTKIDQYTVATSGVTDPPGATQVLALPSLSSVFLVSRLSRYPLLAIGCPLPEIGLV
ncbi:unnamed protein product [Caenorhabditis brenneri]